MIIGIDGNEANLETKVGVHQMAFELLWHLYKNNKLEDTNIKYVIYLKESPRADLPPESDSWRYKVLPGGGMWVLTKLTIEIFFGDRPDVLFTPSHYLPIISPVPMVCMITDLGYLKFSGQFTKKDFWQLKYWTAISLFVSKYIIAISKSTLKDIVRHYKFASNKTSVVSLGPNKSIEDINLTKKFVRRTLNKYRITKKYIAFVSTLKPGKNIEGLVTAFSMLKDKNKYQLVISGKKGWLYETIFEKVKKLRLERYVVFTDYVTEEEKKVLIENALIFALPSYWEGFGIDVLNAFALGTPALISNVASLPEVGGKAAVYVDPYNVASITQGMEEILNMSPKEYNKRVKLGHSQLKKFSWEKSATETLKILRKVANRG